MEKLKDVTETTEPVAEPADTITADALVPERKRGCTPYRFYYGLWIFLFAVGVLMGIVSIGSFGVKHSQVLNFLKDNAPANHRCILFSEKIGEIGNANVISFSNNGVCSFVLVAQAAIILLFIGCLIYNIVLTVLGPKM